MKIKKISQNHHKPKIYVNRFFGIVFLFSGFVLLNNCKTKRIEIIHDKDINEGFACGDIDSLYGNIVIVAPIDSINYLRLNIRGLNTMINSGDFSIDINMENNNETNVELLSFLGTKKENPFGYVWDCSDVGTTMMHPDTLNCLKCHIVVRSSPSGLNDGQWIRIYQLEVSEAIFILENKQKIIRNFISSPIFFSKGYP